MGLAFEAKFRRVHSFAPVRTQRGLSGEKTRTKEQNETKKL